MNKYNIGDKVWVLNNNEVFEGTIEKIEKVDTQHLKINYEIKCKTRNSAFIRFPKPEDKLFKTKQELLDSL